MNAPIRVVVAMVVAIVAVLILIFVVQNQVADAGNFMRGLFP